MQGERPTELGPGMKKSRSRRIPFLPLFLAACLFAGGIYGTYRANKEPKTSPADELPAVSAQGILDGSFQTDFDAYFRSHFPLQNYFLKLRNQIQWSIFDKSPNTHVVKGKDNNLFESLYIEELLKYDSFYTYNDEYLANYDQYWDQVAQDLAYIQGKLAEKGKVMYVFLTPSKAHFMPEAVPDSYVMNRPNRDEVPYAFDVLVEKLDKYGVHYYNSVEYFENTKLDVPLFQKSGIHYTWAAGAIAFRNAVEGINTLTPDHQIKPYTISFRESDKPVFPDDDLYNLLGLMSGTFEKEYGDQIYYEPVYTETDTSGAAGPKVYLQGGSFEGPIIHLFTSTQIASRFRFVQNTAEVDENGTHPLAKVEDSKVLQSLDSDIFLFEINQCATSSPTPKFIANTRRVIEENGVPNP